jgi:hypothetical protein
MGTPFFEPSAQRANINRRWVACVVGMAMLGLGAGCQVPRYQFPAGYSSTYARHLHADIWAIPTPESLPPVESVSQAPGVFYPQSFKYNPPTKSEFQRMVTVLPEDRPIGRGRY